MGRFQILCLSGGGYRGLFTADILAGLEEAAGAPLASRFDLIAGTSVGGIIALGLAAGTPAKEIADAFRMRGRSVFSNRPAPRGWFAQTVHLLKGARRARYGAQPLARLIAELVGAETRIADLGQRVMIPAVNLTKGRPQVFKTPHHRSFLRDRHLLVTDVALATAAAPTYFPIHRIGGEMFADGGLYANAPDLLALHEAEHFLGRDVAEVHVLSIGTTTAAFAMAHASGHDLGWMGWMERQRLTAAMIGAQQINTSAMMDHRLGARYLRIDAAQSAEQQAHLALDVATDDAARTLGGLAEAALRDTVGRADMTAFLSHETPRPLFS